MKIELDQHNCLKSELLEEPLVLSGLVSLFEGLLDRGSCSSLLGGVLKGLLVDVLLVDGDVDRVSGWHNVVVVDDLDERLHLVSLGNLLLAHALRDLSWVSVNAGN